MTRSLLLGALAFVLGASAAPAVHAGKARIPLSQFAGAFCAADLHAGHAVAAPAGNLQPDGANAANAIPAANTNAAFAAAEAAAEPHAGHVMPAPVASTAAARNAAADTQAGGVAPGALPVLVEPAAGDPGPAPPADYAAERFFDPRAMAAARAQLRAEHGRETYYMVFLNMLEILGQDGYRWDGEAWYGGDINRLVVKSEGEGIFGEELEDAEIHAVYSRAFDPYFDFQLGLRQDFGSAPSRTYASAGVEGLAPYFFEVEAALFLSHKGEFFGRIGGTYDQRITQRLILQPAFELNVSAQDVPELGIGSGFSDVELGLRLRYEFRREFAPYVGIFYDRKLGGNARRAGDSTGGTNLVAGIRAWF